jgi:hypothetical protein
LSLLLAGLCSPAISDSPFHNGSSRIKVGLVGRSDSQFDLLFEAAIGSSEGSQAALRPL